MRYPSYDKRICTLLCIISNVVQNVNFSVALLSGSLLAIIELPLCSTNLMINAFVYHKQCSANC